MSLYDVSLDSSMDDGTPKYMLDGNAHTNILLYSCFYRLFTVVFSFAFVRKVIKQLLLSEINQFLPKKKYSQIGDYQMPIAQT